MTERVLVLGCGPAGLFAAQAASECGYEVEIRSRKRRSEMFGAQYLHASIPGLTDDQEPGKVEYRLNGDLDQYLHKVYGDKLPDKVTVDSLVGTYPAWDIRRAYHKAWEVWVDRIRAYEGIGPLAVERWYQEDWAHIISTIPLKSLCRDHFTHEFISRPIWAVGDAPERGVFAPRIVDEPNVILYDGTDKVPWYRASLIHGYNAVEYPIDASGKHDWASIINKPVRHSCTCWPQMIKVGRFGAFHRSGHTHQAYWRILAKLQETA